MNANQKETLALKLWQGSSWPSLLHGEYQHVEQVTVSFKRIPFRRLVMLSPEHKVQTDN